MAATFSNFRQQFSSAPRSQRFLSYALVTYLIYALLLGLLVPYLVKSIAPEKVSELIGRPVLLEDVSINPFTLKFEIKGFEIQSQEQQDFVGIGRLTLQVNLWKSIFNGGINVQTIEVDQAFANIEKLNDNQFNFSDIPEHMAAQATPTEQPEPTIEDNNGESELPLIQIANIGITNTEFYFKDQPTGAELKYPAINIVLSQFNSLAMLVNPKQPNVSSTYNSYDLSIEGADNSAVTTTGRFQLTPLEAKGDLALKHIKLTTFWPFIADMIDAKLASGVIDFATDYQFINDNDTPQLITDAGQFSLRTLVFTDPEQAIVNLPLLTVAGIKVNLLEQQIGLDNISTDGLQVHAAVDKDGVVNLANAFTPKQTVKSDSESNSNTASTETQSTETDSNTTSTETQSTESAQQQDWLVTLGEFNLTNYDINVIESMMTDATAWRVFPINISTKSLTSRLDTPIEYDLALTINDKGTFSSQGSADVKAQALDATINLDKLNLAQFQPYLKPYVNMTITSGEFTTQGSLYANAKGAARFDGSIKLEALAINDKKLNKTLLKWHDFNINNLKFDKNANSLHIDHIALNQPYAQMIVAADKSSNVSNLVVESKTADSKAPVKEDQPQGKTTEAAQEPMRIEINKISLTKGKVDYTDNVLKPTFEATIDKLEGHIGKISSTATKNAEINIKGIVNEYAPLTLHGEINPLIPQPYVDIEFVFDNFELPSMTPYSGTYAGLDIDEGQLSLALKYKLEKEHLDGTNKIFIDQLDMNSTKGSDVGTILPITLAIPLLKDSNGAIDLGVDISGDVNDPSFNVGEILLKQLSNIILKAATSPFTLLASIVDTTDELDKVNFVAGSALLVKAEQNKLDKLAAALAKRPQLKLNVKGSYDAKADKKTLQNLALNNKLSESAGRVIDATVNATNIPADMTEALIDLYEQETQGEADSLRTAIAKQQPTLASAELEKVWLRSLYTETSKQQTVTEKSLKDLAKSRANSIKTHLREVSKVASGRIFVLSHQNKVISTSTQTTLTLVVK